MANYCLKYTLQYIPLLNTSDLRLCKGMFISSRNRNKSYKKKKKKPFSIVFTNLHSQKNIMSNIMRMELKFSRNPAFEGLKNKFVPREIIMLKCCQIFVLLSYHNLADDIFYFHLPIYGKIIIFCIKILKLRFLSPVKNVPKCNFSDIKFILQHM